MSNKKIVKGVKVTTMQKGKTIVVLDENINPVYLKPTFQTRVADAKSKLSELGFRGCKTEFYDLYYGAQTKYESTRTDNLWAGYISEEKFTLNLEQYVTSKQR
jgi:hypothetical protein